MGSEQLYLFFSIIFSIFISNQCIHSKMLKMLNIHCYSYQIIEQFYYLNGVHVLTECGTAPSDTIVDQVWRSFFSRREHLSKHSYKLLSLIYL